MRQKTLKRHDEYVPTYSLDTHLRNLLRDIQALGFVACFYHKREGRYKSLKLCYGIRHHTHHVLSGFSLSRYKRMCARDRKDFAERMFLDFKLDTGQT